MRTSRRRWRFGDERSWRSRANYRGGGPRLRRRTRRKGAHNETSLLDARNAEVIDSRIEDYATESTTRETWASYDGTQQGDPLKLGQALVRIAAMDAPLKLFVAGSDAIEVLLPVAQARVRAIEDNAALSGSTDGW